MLKKLRNSILVLSLVFLTGCVDQSGNQSGELTIAASSVAVAEILDALEVDASQVVGIPSSETYAVPERYKDATKLGSAMTPGMEILTKLNPQLIISPNSLESDLQSQYEKIGISSAFVNLKSVSGMYKSIDDLGKRLNKEEKAEEITIDKRDLVAKEDVYVILTREGYIKRSTLKSFKASNGTLPGLKEGDSIVLQTIVNTIDYILAFTNKGNYLFIPVHLINEIKWKDEGKHINSIVTLPIDENIIKAIVVKNFDKDVSIAFVSKNNYIKKTKLKEFYTTRFSKPITCMRLNNGDELVDVSVVNGNSNFLITTKLGNSTYFNENQIEATGLRTLGVKAISTLKNSYICSLLSYRHDEKGKILFITDKGAARIFDISKLELTQRLGKTQKVFESFKSDLHSCVFATKILNTKEPLKLNALMSDNSITELIIDDFKITPEKNCKNNLNIDESKTIKQIFISEVQVIDDNTIVETPSNEDKHISNNSINNVYKKDENTEEEYEQISIFDEMGD